MRISAKISRGDYKKRANVTVEDIIELHAEWRNEKGWLTDTCLDGQDTFVRLLDMLEMEVD